MREKRPRPTHKIDTLAPGNVPIDVRAMAAKDLQVQKRLMFLHASGAQVSISRLDRVSDKVRGIVHGAPNADQVIQEALSPTSKDSKLTPVRREIKEALVFSASNEDGSPLTGLQRRAVKKLNGNATVQGRREEIATTRLKQDRPKKVVRRFQGAGSAITAAIGLSEASGLWFGNIGKTMSLLFSQLTDDTLNTFIVPGTAEGGEKSKKQILKENKMLLPFLVGFGVGDYTIIPHLLESPSLPVRVIGGVVFTSSVVGGSMGANLLHLSRLYEQKQKFSDAWKDHVSDPFRKTIWYGSAVSLIASVGTAAAKVLVDKEWSGALEMIIGMTESAPGFLGLLFAKPFSRSKRNVRDLLLVNRARGPKEIFPNVT